VTLINNYVQNRHPKWLFMTVRMNRIFGLKDELYQYKYMKFEFRESKLDSILGLTDDIKKDQNRFSGIDSTIKFLWNRNEKPVTLEIDGLPLELMPNQMVTTTYLQHVSFKTLKLPLTAILFNREFYCISDHDSEVSCNGILFFGTQDLPIITIPLDLLKRFDSWYDVFAEEFTTPDKIQGDMLQMLLKRFIIMSTRLAKEQLIVKELNNDQVEVIRKFNYLVDNLFSIYNQKSPQRIILDRIALEAKRLIHFTEKQNQEIAYELGFNDPAHFSRFFKKMTQMTPSEYRENKQITS